MSILEVKNLSIQFGGLKAVDNFNMTIEKGQLYGLIGPNGAGKTTVFNMLTGVYNPTAGQILLDGQDITGLPTIKINRMGIARTFQNIRLFSDLSVLDNVKVGLHNQIECSFWSNLLRLPSNFKLEREMNAPDEFLVRRNAAEQLLRERIKDEQGLPEIFLYLSAG